MTSSRRQRRVAELIQEELSTFLERRVDDPSLEWVTVTAVQVTPDLQLARVYFSVIGDEDRRHAAQQGLERATGYLRRELARALRLRLVPELRFVYDDSLDQGKRIDELLEEIRDEGEGHADA